MNPLIRRNDWRPSSVRSGQGAVDRRGKPRHHLQAGIEPSVGSVGDSYDNALAETINGLYKTEFIHRRGPWRGFEAVEYDALELVDWFNDRRLL